MAIRRIIRMGHPLLRQAARPLEPHEIAGDETKRLIADMIDTLHDYGGIGLAAPQIAEPVRLAIIEIRGEPTRYGELEPIPLSVFINPVIEIVDPATEGFWEGCLSVPGLRGWVERPSRIRVEYLDESAAPRELVAEGFLATVCQHELDHLDGVLYVDKIASPDRFAFVEEYTRFHHEPPEED